MSLVRKYLTIEKPVFAGYDSGATAGLKVALKHPKLFKSVIAFHPSYSEETKDELRAMKVPVLI